MVALVTGAAVGIGRAIALALFAQGMDTWLVDVHARERARIVASVPRRA